MSSFVTGSTILANADVNSRTIISDIKNMVNGFLSVSSGDARVSVIKDGFQYSSPNMRAAVTKNALNFQYNLSNSAGVLNAQLTKNNASIGYKLSF